MLRLKRAAGAEVGHGLYFESWFRGKPLEPRGWAIAAQVIAGVLAILLGAVEFVDQIIRFSADAHLNPGVLSLILSPLATELPEKYNSVVWIRQGKDHLALANITGAMVFQSCIPVAIGLAYSPWHLTNPELLAGSIALASVVDSLHQPARLGARNSDVDVRRRGLRDLSDRPLEPRRALNRLATICPMRAARVHTRSSRIRMTTYQEISAQFYSNRLLFGDPGDPGVVAVEVASKTEIDVYKRLAGNLTRERRPIRLFAIVENMALLEGFKAPHETRVLDGDFRYRILVTFDSLDALDAARRHLRNVTDKAPNAPDAPYLVLADPVEQHLMLTGTTFFIGLDFSDLRRLQLDIETYISPGFEFPSAAREGDRVIAISLTDSTGFERLLKGTEMDERAMLEEMVRDYPGARSRRGRRPQSVSLRSRISRDARAAASGAAAARTRRR